MKNTEYAIVDIETTGGNASGSCITEIAIVIHDGKKVMERFETLVNPQKEIPLPIFALTGDMTMEAKLKVVSAGMNEYFNKPVQMDDVLHTIKSYVL